MNTGENNNTGAEVSDNELSDMDDDELDKLIDGPEMNQIGNHSSTNTLNATASANTILNREYGEDLPPPSLPSVSDLLANTVTKWSRITPSRDSVRELFKEIIGPDNVRGLNPVRINDVIYQALPFKAKINDQCLRGINTYLARSLGPLTSILDRLISAEDCLLDSDSVQVTPEETVLDIIGKSKLSLDIGQIRKQLHNSVKLLSFCHSVVLQKCRTMLKPFILPKYQHLTKPTSEICKELMGSNVEQKIMDSSKLNEAARKISKNFRGRGRFGSRRGRFMGGRRGNFERRQNHHDQQSHGFGQNSNSHSGGSHLDQRFQQESYNNNSDFHVKRSGFKPRGRGRFFRRK